MEKIIVGSRGSLLALRQTEIIITELKRIYPGKEFLIKKIKTKGDKILDSPLSKLVNQPGGTKGLFTKEIEEALLRREIDLAVHSMKDLPTEIPEGLIIGAVPKRVSTADILITREKKKFSELPPGARIGTSSLRRRAQLLSLKPDLEIVDLRGNLDTRLRKLDTQNLDGIVVALAGLERMQFTEKDEGEILDFILPAVGQGAIGIEIREEVTTLSDRQIKELVEKINDKISYLTVSGERAFLEKLGGGCQVPIGIKSAIVDQPSTQINGSRTLKGALLVLEGIVLSPDGEKHFRDKICGPLNNAVTLGRELAEKLIIAGAQELLS